jgi:threonine dehydrogenase-like Zn-dependent dehydrogenase
MRGAVMHAPGDVEVVERPDPELLTPTDAVIRLAATCICGSDLWPWRGIEEVTDPSPMGHEYVGVVEQIGDEVRNIKVGDFVVGSFFASDNTCEICQAGYQSRCIHAHLMGAEGTQAELARVPMADGTLVATPGTPDADLIPSLMAASDVLGTGWFGAVAAEAGPGKTVASSVAISPANSWRSSSAPPTSSSSAVTKASPRSRTSPAATARTA